MTRTLFQRQTYQRLIKRREALRAALAGDQTLLHSLSQEGVGDEIDAVVVSEQAELRSQLAQVESRELAQIDRAIEKLRTGRYGHCETCERPISPLRLKYVPYAADCIGCARRQERRDSAATTGKPVNRIAAYAPRDDEPAAEDLELELR